MTSSVIQHIVLSGGGAAGFAMYGALRESNKSGFWQPENIKSIWGTSVGAIIGSIICISTDWDTLDSFLIRRPWDKVLPINLYTLMNAYSSCGLFSVPALEQMLSPLLLSRDYDINVTMQQLYDRTGIDLHVIATEINQNVCVDISHETHPNWRLVDAVFSSCSLPGLFSPYIDVSIPNSAFMDGGLLCDYPINNCVEKYSLHENLKSVFGIVHRKPATVSTYITRESTLLDYITKLTMILLNTNLEKQLLSSIKIPHEMEIFNIPMSAIQTAISSEDTRRELVEIGKNAWYATHPKGI